MSDCIEIRSPCHVCGAPECCAVCCDLNTKNEKLSARVAELERRNEELEAAPLEKHVLNEDRVAQLEEMLIAVIAEAVDNRFVLTYGYKPAMEKAVVSLDLVESSNSAGLLVNTERQTRDGGQR